jgi:hypothetical protein
MWRFPARFLAEFFDNNGMLGFAGRRRIAHDPRRLAPLRGGADATVRRPHPPAHAGEGDPPPRRPRDRRRRALRPRGPRRPRRPVARHALRSTPPPGPAPSSATARSAATAAPTSAAPTGAGASTRTGSPAPSASPSGSAGERL